MDLNHRTLAALAAALLLAPVALRAQDAPAENEEQLIKVLESDAGLFEKAKACQRLAVVGDKDAVPALAKLLSDKSLAHYARFGLEPNPDPSVDAALRQALAALKGDLRIGVINSIGARRDAQALDDLTALLGDADQRTAAAAAAAIGRVGTPGAARILREALPNTEGGLRTDIAAACLPCAEKLLADGRTKAAIRAYQVARRANTVPQHVKMAALRGILLARGAEGLPQLVKTLKGKNEKAFDTALIAVREVAGDGVTQGIVAELGGLAPSRQAKLIGVLGERGDRAALPAVLEATRSGDANVRLAAIGTLKSLGDASAVPVLIELAAHSDGETAQLAQATLAGLPGKEIDNALLARLTQGGDAVLRPAVLEAVGHRGIRSAVPTLRKAAVESEGATRLAAISALGQTVTLDELPILIAGLSRAGTPEEKDAVRDALKTASSRVPDRDACTAKLADAMKGATVDEQCVLLEVFPVVGSESASAVVSESAKSSNATIRRAATKVLGDWPTEQAAHSLLGLIESSTGSEDRMLALQAFSGLVRRLGFDKDERLGVCRRAMELSRSDEERKVVLHTLSGIPAPETLEILQQYLANDGLREDACLASVTICERLIRSRQRGAVAQCMTAVLEVTKNEETKDRAQALLRQAGGR